MALSIRDGKILWSQPLPAAPVPWGVLVDRDGRVLVSLAAANWFAWQDADGERLTASGGHEPPVSPRGGNGLREESPFVQQRGREPNSEARYEPSISRTFSTEPNRSSTEPNCQSSVGGSWLFDRVKKESGTELPHSKGAFGVRQPVAAFIFSQAQRVCTSSPALFVSGRIGPTGPTETGPTDIHFDLSVCGTYRSQFRERPRSLRAAFRLTSGRRHSALTTRISRILRSAPGPTARFRLSFHSAGHSIGAYERCAAPAGTRTNTSRNPSWTPRTLDATPLRYI